MKAIGEMTAAELSAFVQSHLKKLGIDVVLSGGSVVTIYSKNKYVSQDLDLVNIYAVNHRKIRAAMAAIGFREEGRCFTHEETQLLIEFPPGPLAIGSEAINEVVEKELSTGTLRIISPTDCVKDRLAAYYHWGDRQCLAQAEYVAQAQDIDMEAVRAWSAREGMLAKFEEIEAGLR